MTTDPDPFEQGQRAARKSIPAEANPYREGSEEHSLWAAGHERVAGGAKAQESEGTQGDGAQPIFFRPFLNRDPLPT
jgi:hypothetical protein